MAERLVARPRLNRLILDLVESHRLVWITATAGAGKTTAVVQASAALDRHLVWLTLDSTDAAPGRLLVYLEAAIAAKLPEVQGLVNGVLAARVPHTEAAGLLADATAQTPLVLVLDGLEHLNGAQDALSIVGAFIRYAPASLKIILLSRVDAPLDLGSLIDIDQVAAVGEDQLAFTPPEAAEALSHAGMTDIEPERAVEVTGGWVTGVLFEAWRSRQHVAGTGGEADPLHGYLASQILGRLEPAEQEFLITTSLLDEVSAARAAGLGASGAGDRMVTLRANHLPVSWTTDTYSMRAHPRFREYLITLLERRDRAEVQALRSGYAALLRSEGHLEESVEQFLKAESLDEALETAEIAISKLIERLDFAVAERWLEVLAPPDSIGARRLGTARLMLAIGREDYLLACSIADGLQAVSAREALARSSAIGASIMAWCYWHLNRLEDMHEVMELAPPSPEVDAVRYLLALVDLAPSNGRSVVPVLTGGPLDALVMRVHYAHGRLKEVSRTPTSPWAAAISAPWRAGALRATGHLAEALELYWAADAGSWSQAWLHGIVGPELMIDLKRAEEARRVIARGRKLIRESGSVVFEWLNRLIEAKLELRLNRDPAAALIILDEVEAAGGGHYAFIAEGLNTWRGLALLLAEPGGEAAAAILRRAVDSMLAASRTIDLPAAAVYLAEAQWRCGKSSEADAAADQALSAAALQGSDHQLLLALADFEAVVARRLDAESGADSRWHDLGRALILDGVPVDAERRSSVVLREFGRISITVNGRVTKPRIAKSSTLLAYLASMPGHRASRDQLLAALFDGHTDDSSRSYLRQAAHRLREALPEGIGPAFSGGELTFTSAVALDSESGRFEALLAEAARLNGVEKLNTLLRALEIADHGEYLPGTESAWAAGRRSNLEDQAAHARLQAAQLAFAGQHFQQAVQLTERVVGQDPFKESAWRLLMRIANAVGDEDRVVASFRRCAEALRELGVEPSDSTRQLFDRLRR